MRKDRSTDLHRAALFWGERERNFLFMNSLQLQPNVAVDSEANFHSGERESPLTRQGERVEWERAAVPCMLESFFLPYVRGFPPPPPPLLLSIRVFTIHSFTFDIHLE
jgi:hypothetical protein